MSIPVERRTKRWREQRWILDNIIQAVGVEWDQARIGYTLGPCGPEAFYDFNVIRQRVKKFAEIAPPKKLVVYQGERHGIGGGPAAALGPQWLNTITDWFCDRFTQKSMQSERVLVDLTGQQHTTQV